MAKGRSSKMKKHPNTKPHPTGHEAQVPVYKTTPVQSESHSPLVDLPPELRNRIYEFAVSSTARITITKSHGFPEPALLLTSKTIRKEAIGIFYTINGFSLSSISYDPSTCLHLHRKGLALWKTYRIDTTEKDFSIVRSGAVSWKNLKFWIRLRYDGHDKMVLSVPVGAMVERLDAESKVTGAMIVMADRMKASPWEEVETVLELLRAGLVAIDGAWGLDQ